MRMPTDKDMGAIQVALQWMLDNSPGPQMKFADWRLVQYGQGAALLCHYATQIVRERQLPAVVLDTRTPAGSVLVNGTDIGKLKNASVPYLRRNMGLIFQQQRLLNDRSILANVMLPLLVTGASHREAASRARAALDKVGLAERAEAQPLSLSGGEQQRVSIARAIVNRPQLILADEPTANLDRASANRVLEALQAFHSVGVTCIISSHDEQMLDAAARVIHLNQGQLEDAA